VEGNHIFNCKNIMQPSVKDVQIKGIQNKIIISQEAFLNVGCLGIGCWMELTVSVSLYYTDTIS
jgi:hypothetical protein